MLLGSKGMIGALKNAIDAWRGAGQHSVTVPPMDGALGPNQDIEEAPSLLAIDAPDNLVADGSRILFSSGASVLALKTDGVTATAAPVETFDQAVTALAAHAGGGTAIGLEDGRLVLKGGKHDGKTLSQVGGQAIVCPTAMQFADSDTLLLAIGSRQNAPSRWKHDLMQKNASGSVWRIDLASGNSTCLGDQLAYPYGLLALADGSLIVSESWRNQLIRLGPNGQRAVQFADITGYPARLAAAMDGGAWLAVFAPRSQLIEFVLREKDYRTQMMADIPEGLWVAPSISPTRTFLEPLQGGALKQLGILKPWAPTRSYGLLVRLYASFEARDSMHSRADGRRHGMTSCVEVGGKLVATSKGGDVIVSLPLGDRNGG
jgi:hypothetical protein